MCRKTVLCLIIGATLHKSFRISEIPNVFELAHRMWEKVFNPWNAKVSKIIKHNKSAVYKFHD